MYAFSVSPTSGTQPYTIQMRMNKLVQPAPTGFKYVLRVGNDLGMCRPPEYEPAISANSTMLTATGEAIRTVSFQPGYCGILVGEVVRISDELVIRRFVEYIDNL